MSSVSWGKRQRFRFSSEGELNSWTPRVAPAVYAITYKQDPSSRPKSHTVFYFGQADDVSRAVPLVSREVEKMWVEHGGQVGDLYIFVHEMPGSTSQERDSIQRQLVSEYWPHGNN